MSIHLKMSYEDNPFEDETVAKEWINAIESEEGGAREKEIYPLIQAWVKKNSPETIVEIGAGQGICSQYSGDRIEYTGLEPSQLLVDRARELYGASSRKFIKGSAYNLPFADKSTDAVFSVGVWFHIENLDAAHKEISRILKKNGKILLITANPDSYPLWESLFETKKTGKILDGKVKVPTGMLSRNRFYLHTEEDIVKSLEKNHLEIANIKKFGIGSHNIKNKDIPVWMAIEATTAGD